MGFIKRFIINMTVRSAHGFWPDKQLVVGLSGEKANVHQISLTLLAGLLVKYARRRGPIDESRLRLLERVHGHFSEHYLYVELPIRDSLENLRDMSNHHSVIGESDYERELETQLGDIGRKLPEVVKKELLTHLAMFQRLDMHSIEHEERKAAIRVEHGILFGSATQADVDSILDKAAGYKIEQRRKEEEDIPYLNYWIRQWAESLGTMTFEFRTRYIGMDRHEAIRQIRETWHGSEVTEVNREVFAVRHQKNLEPFVFLFNSPSENDGKIQLIVIETNPPFANVTLAINQRTTNYLLRCPRERLNKQEKKLCKALEKYGKIPQGRIT